MIDYPNGWRYEDMRKYLVVYKYKGPNELKANVETGSDKEAFQAVWIGAECEQDVLKAGRGHAEQYVVALFEAAGVTAFEGWTAGNYAHWIEQNPLNAFSGLALEMFDEIIAAKRGGVG